MPQENQQKTMETPEIEYYVAGSDGQVFHNKEKLPLDTLQNFEQFNEAKGLLRFAFDAKNRVLYVQDGQKWHDRIIKADDDNAWNILNHALRFIRQEFDAQPKLQFGEPANTAEKRNLSQFPVAWEAIRNYIKKEFAAEAKEIPIVEYIPEGPSADRVKFMPDGGEVSGVKVAGPAIFINRNIGMFSQPDYERINHLLTHEYLKNYAKIEPERFDEHHNGDAELYFAIWKDGTTKLFKANTEQQFRMYDEDALRKEPALKNYKGPLLMFSFFPQSKKIALHDNYRDNLEKYGRTRQMLDDIKRRLVKKKGLSEISMVIADDDVSTKPMITKLSKFDILWDLINDFLSPGAGIAPKDIPVVQVPLTSNGKVKAMLVEDLADEESIPVARQMRIKHGIAINYPFIAVDSRIKSEGMLFHVLLREYAKTQPELQHLPILDYMFAEDYNEGDKFLDFANNSEEMSNTVDAMEFMVRSGMPSKAIIDFFSPRKNLIHRAVYTNHLDMALKKIEEDQVKRSPLPPMSKKASIDSGINDWYWVGLQEQMNTTKHVNDQQAEPAGGATEEIKPFNLRRKQLLTGPRSTEGLLHHQHDEQLNYMKTMEQLLRESRI